MCQLTSFLHSYYQGLLVHAHRTRGITEAVAVGLTVTGLLLLVGIWTAAMPGASAAFAAITGGAIAQTVWLWWRWWRVSQQVRCGTLSSEPQAELL